MAVNVRIPEALRKLTGGHDVVAVEAANIREMLNALEAKHPGLKERICDEQGNVRRFVNIFVTEEDIRFLQNLDTPLAPGSEVSVLPAIAGGAGKPSKAEKAEAAKGESAQSVRRVYLTFGHDAVMRPIIYDLIQRFKVIPNIRGASVTDDVGIMSLEMTGPADELDGACAWLRKQNVKVDPIEMNVVEP